MVASYLKQDASKAHVSNVVSYDTTMLSRLAARVMPV